MPSTAKVNRASQVGIHGYDSRNWNRSPPGSNAIHMTTREREHDQRPGQRDLLGQLGLGCAAGTPPPGRRPAGSTVSTDRNGKSLHVTPAIPPARPGTRATTSSAPPSMDRAYERTKPVCSRRSRPEPPPTAGGEPVDQPVDAPVVEVDQRPGQVLARLLEDRLVERVGVEVAAGGGDHRRRPAAPAAAVPLRNSTNAEPGAEHGDHQRQHRDRACGRGDAVRLAPRRRAPAVEPVAAPSVAIRQPAPTEPTASRISGIVIIGGDSCGCSMSSVHRFGPWKVSTNSRVM